MRTPDVDFDSKAATALRQQLFQSDWQQSMAEDSMSRDTDIKNDDNADGGSSIDTTSSTPTTMMTATSPPPAIDDD